MLYEPDVLGLLSAEVMEPGSSSLPVDLTNNIFIGVLYSSKDAHVYGGSQCADAHIASDTW